MAPIGALLVLLVCAMISTGNVSAQNRSDEDSGEQVGAEFPSQLIDIMGQRVKPLECKPGSQSIGNAIFVEPYSYNRR
jgi:hypothetical protein